MQSRILATAAIAAVAVTAPAAAGELPFGVDLYLGAFGGYGGSLPHSVDAPELENRVYTTAEAYPNGGFWGGYAGAGYGPLALELGALELPAYHGYAEGINPLRAAHQDITGRALFVRGVVRVPPAWHWPVAPFVAFGAAQVRSKNHEYGWCLCKSAGDGRSDGPDEWSNDMRTWTHMLGAGAEIPIYGPVSGRLEADWLPHAQNSFWTDNRDFWLVSAGLQVRF